MVEPEPAHRDVSVAEGSVLFVSAHVASTHPNYGMYRPGLDAPPDLDLNRLLETAGGWTRRFFHPHVIDAANTERAYPKKPDGLSAVVVGGSLYYVSPVRGPLAPWQEELIEFVRQSILEWDLGFLGLCGGGQIGLRALGGLAAPNPPDLSSNGQCLAGNELVRTGELILTAAGSTDPIFDGCPARFPVQESHSDHLAEVPASMVVLAQSTDIPNQVLGWRDRVRLFQPHPELSLAFMRRVLRALSSRAGSPAAAKELRQASSRLRQTRIANDRIVPNFLRMIGRNP